MKKLIRVLQSRKFWALVIALFAIWTAAYNQAMTIPEAINATVGALAAYMIGTGLDNPAPTQDLPLR
jgi:hypothetical protein